MPWGFRRRRPAITNCNPASFDGGGSIKTGGVQMMAKVDACREIAWHEKMKTDLGIADALECDVAMAREIVDALFRARSKAGFAPVERCHGTEAGIRLAIAHALHKVAGLGLTDAAAVSAGSRQVSASLTKLLEFRPRGLRPGENDLPDGGCADPLMLFAAHAAEAIPIAAADEYLDVADGRRVYWRKPRRDAHALACELHRLSCASRREDTPALQEEYLELLARLREPEDHVCEWIGTVADGRFHPAPDRFSERSPGMRQGPSDIPLRSFAESYATKVSVNVSLAARSMKRRALGLAVVDPLKMSAIRKGKGQP